MSNFTVQLLICDGEVESSPDILTQSLRRITARMWNVRRPSAKTLHADTAKEGFRLFFGVHSLGTNAKTERLIMEELLRYEGVVHNDGPLHGKLRVHFLGELETFRVSEFNIVAITSDPKTSYMEFEVRVILVQHEQR